jgi:hypothetical protein
MLLPPIVGLVIGLFLPRPSRAFPASGLAWVLSLVIAIAVVDDHDGNFWTLALFSLLVTAAFTWLGMIVRRRRSAEQRSFR